VEAVFHIGGYLLPQLLKTQIAGIGGFAIQQAVDGSVAGMVGGNEIRLADTERYGSG
jgi:hypothetical protein